MQVLLQFMEKNSRNHDWHSSGTVQENREHAVLEHWNMFSQGLGYRNNQKRIVHKRQNQYKKIMSKKKIHSFLIIL